jgi:N-carbamoylputrescine amidase
MKDIRIAAVTMQSGFGEVEANLDRMERYVLAAAKQRADVICFPEMNITGYALKKEIQSFAEPVPGPSTVKVQRMADECDITVIAGLAERTEHDGTAITQVVASPGRDIGKYRKIHLSTGEQAIFQAGEGPAVFEANGTLFGLQLCYDAHFPELSTILALEGAEILFISHASPAPESAEQKRDRWLRYLGTRAYDNSVFVVACNQVGDGGAGIKFSGIVLVLDPRGDVVAEACGDDERMVVVDLSTDVLEKTRNTRMGFFLSHRRPELYTSLSTPTAETGIARPEKKAETCEAKTPGGAECARATSGI